MRLSNEPGNETGRNEWRGQITHVQSGESRYFVTLAQLEEFIRQRAPDRITHKD